MGEGQRLGQFPAVGVCSMLLRVRLKENVGSEVGREGKSFKIGNSVGENETIGKSILKS